MTMDEFYGSKYGFVLTRVPIRQTEWVECEPEEMDTEEKRATGGYLKIYTYKEACAKWWAAMGEEDKEIIKSMPNFDKDVFKDITGIEV